MEYFGYHDVNALRTALYRFPDEPAIKSAYYGESWLTPLKKRFFYSIRNKYNTRLEYR